MSKNGKTIAYTGYARVVPSNGWATSQSWKSHTSMTRTAYNYNNYKVSNRYTGTHNSGNCLTKSKNGKTIAHIGYARVVPSNGLATNQSNQSGNSHTSMTRTAYNYNNYKVSKRYTGTHNSRNCLTMSKKGKTIAYTGYARVVPSNGWATNQSNQSGNSHTSMRRTAYNDNNHKVSNRYTETHNSGNYVTRSGSVGYKQEAKATSTVKVSNKVQGFTTEYKTQVNVKQVVYPTPAKSSSYKNINYY